jgi:hypothetical protein
VKRDASCIYALTSLAQSSYLTESHHHYAWLNPINCCRNSDTTTRKIMHILKHMTQTIWQVIDYNITDVSWKQRVTSNWLKHYFSKTVNESTVRSLIKLYANLTSRLPVEIAWLSTKKVFPIRVKYRFIKTIKSTDLYYTSYCREPGSDSCVQLYQWKHCTYVFNCISESTVQLVRWDMSFGLELCRSFPARTKDGGYAELSVLSAVTESTSCVKFYFNNISPFIIRPVIFSVVSLQREQNARRGQSCKENRGTQSNTQSE